MDKHVSRSIYGWAKEDFKVITRSVNEKLASPAITSSIIMKQLGENAIQASTTFQVGDNNITKKITYTLDGDSVYADTSIEAAVSDILHKTRIVAADEDDGFGFDEYDDDLLDEDIDDESEEGVDSAEEEFSEFDEEDPESYTSIKVDNNIEGHYIVECDRCHGIFISALTESDQYIDHISGTCPLCDKDSDQYVKWIVKAVEHNEEFAY